MFDYLIIYRQYIRICNESIYLSKGIPKTEVNNKVINDSHQSDEKN